MQTNGRTVNVFEHWKLVVLRLIIKKNANNWPVYLLKQSKFSFLPKELCNPSIKTTFVSINIDLTKCPTTEIFETFALNSGSKVLILCCILASRGEHTGIQTEEKVIQEEVEAVVVVVSEGSAPKVSLDPCPNLMPVPATPPKPASSQQATPQTPASEGKKKPEPPAEVIEVPKALPPDHPDQKRMLVEMCVRALFLCLGRFPQHYKSLYRLAFFYANSKTHQVSPALLTDGQATCLFQQFWQILSCDFNREPFRSFSREIFFSSAHSDPII